MTINLDLLDEESAVEAIEIVDELAEANNIDWALVGGLAMALYGSDRTTKDIDIIADKLLPLEKVGDLVQGGERYLIKKGFLKRLKVSCNGLQKRFNALQ